jgi:hypothetical protein
MAATMNCPRCGSDDGIDVTTLDQAYSRYICGSCGLGYQDVPFYWVKPYSPPRQMLYHRPARWFTDIEIQEPLSDRPYIMAVVYCGPPAPFPPVPTPDQILRAAGMDPDTLLPSE